MRRFYLTAVGYHCSEVGVCSIQGLGNSIVIANAIDEPSCVWEHLRVGSKSRYEQNGEGTPLKGPLHI